MQTLYISRRPCLANNCKHCDKMESKEKVTILECPCVCTKPQNVVTTADTNVVNSLGYSNIREVQLQDPDMQPILEWKEKSEDRPNWQSVSSYSPTTKHYWSQWKSLQVTNGVLYRMWETPARDRVIPQMVLPKKMRSFCSTTQQPHCWPPRSKQDFGSDQAKILLASLSPRCK